MIKFDPVHSWIIINYYNSLIHSRSINNSLKAMNKAECFLHSILRLGNLTSDQFSSS